MGGGKKREKKKSITHQKLGAARLQVVQLLVHVRQLPVDAVQLGLEVLVFLMVAVKLLLVRNASVLVGDAGELAVGGKVKKYIQQH